MTFPKWSCLFSECGISADGSDAVNSQGICGQEYPARSSNGSLQPSMRTSMRRIRSHSWAGTIRDDY
jgi:hypothetical protein